MAVSPDGSKMCLYFTKHPQMTFTIPQRGPATYDGGALKDEALGVIEMGSWSVLYSAQLRAKPTLVSFFAQSEALYAETLTIADSADFQHLVIDLPARKLVERVSPYRVDELSVHYSALTRPLLIGVESVREKGPSATILATLPDYKETARVPFAVSPERVPANQTRAFLFPPTARPSST